MKFMVLRKNGGSLTLTEVGLVEVAEEGTKLRCLELNTSLDASYRNRDGLIKVLVWMDKIVRFFDEEEREWVEVSKENGSVVVKGNRDGSWGRPTKEEFERDYLHLV